MNTIEAGHNLPQETPDAFADAVLTVREWLRAGESNLRGVAVWDELKVALLQLRDQQAGTLMHYPTLDGNRDR
jgi:hypothetical protein